jgi:hypothetical protein
LHNLPSLLISDKDLGKVTIKKLKSEGKKAKPPINYIKI